MVSAGGAVSGGDGSRKWYFFMVWHCCSSLLGQFLAVTVPENGISLWFGIVAPHYE